jgi:transcriptional regulator with XRE-family HTH domain
MTNDDFKAIRKRLGFNQAELAALLGYGSAVRISEFERSTNPVAVPRLVAMVMTAMDETGWRPRD